MSKTFNKNIQYTFNPQIVLPTSSSLNVTSPTHTIGTLIVSNSSTINYRPVRILSSSGSTLGAALHVNHNTLHPMSGSVTFNDSFGLRINGGNSGSGTTGCSWIFSQNGDLGLSLFLHQASTNTYSPTVGFTVNTIGNIGIGTTSPSALLHIDGNGTLFRSNFLSNTSGRTWTITNPAVGDPDSAPIVFGCNNSWAFNVDGATALSINEFRDVCVGTTVASTLLHLFDSNPTLRIQHNSGTTAVNSGTIELVQSNLTGVRMRYDGASDIFLLQHLTSGVTQANGVFSSDGGNIGIRNSAPAYNLDVTGNFRTTGIIYSNDTTSVSATSNNYSTTSGSLNLSGDIIIQGSNELMFTGTGISPPSLNGRSSGTKLVLFPGTNITAGDYSLGIENRNMWFQVPSSREGFKFYQGTSANLVMITNGNIGIGITNPSTTLHVDGDLTISNRSSSVMIQPGLTQSTSNTSYTQYEMAGTGIHYFWDNLQASGSITGASKNFCIKHPLNSNKALVHAAIEAPRYDLIYSGRVNLVSGQAIVNVDVDSCPEHPMENGTFEALTRNPRIFLQNNASFDRVKASLNGNLLTILCENINSTDIIDWMIIAERKDDELQTSKFTDDNNYLITEHILEDVLLNESYRPSNNLNL